jgi:hypothetical protein
MYTSAVTPGILAVTTGAVHPGEEQLLQQADQQHQQWQQQQQQQQQEEEEEEEEKILYQHCLVSQQALPFN